MSVIPDMQYRQDSGTHQGRFVCGFCKEHKSTSAALQSHISILHPESEEAIPGPASAVTDWIKGTHAKLLAVKSNIKERRAMSNESRECMAGASKRYFPPRSSSLVLLTLPPASFATGALGRVKNLSLSSASTERSRGTVLARQMALSTSATATMLKAPTASGGMELVTAAPPKDTHTFEDAFAMSQKRQERLSDGASFSSTITKNTDTINPSNMIPLKIDSVDLSVTRTLTSHYAQSREKKLKKLELERNRLMVRLEKLKTIHDNFCQQSEAKFSLRYQLNLVSAFSPLREAEKGVVQWESDKSVLRCPFCELRFSLWRRRHHCRLCGIVVCGSDECCQAMPLAALVDPSSKLQSVIVCIQCHQLLAARQERENELQVQPTYCVLFQKLKDIREQIEGKILVYRESVERLKLGADSEYRNDMNTRTSKIRDDLGLDFARYLEIGKAIYSLPTTNPYEKTLIRNIFVGVNTFLQDNKCVLDSRSKADTEEINVPSTCPPPPASSTSAIVSFKSIETVTDIFSMLSGVFYATEKQVPLSNEGREKLFRELEVLTQQRSIVLDFIQKAHRMNKLEDCAVLNSNLNDLMDQIRSIKSIIHSGMITKK